MGTSALSVRQFLLMRRFRAQGRLSRLAELRRMQWMSPEACQALRDEKLVALLGHAHAHVPYYREELRRAGVVDAKGAVDLSAFRRIRPLDKPSIREQFEHLKSDDLARRDWVYEHSGGSTGEPITLIHGRGPGWGSAMTTLFDEWSGRALGERQVLLWGSERDLMAGGEGRRVRFGRWVRNEVWLNAFRMTEERMRIYVAQINAARPVQVLAYATSAYDFARFIEREGLRVHAPRGTMTSAGTLTDPMREQITRTFRAPVFNRYGSREVGNCASECDAHEGLHVAVPTHHLEIVRPDGSPAAPGELGELLVTSLTNRAMPLIRYRIGDMASWAERPCSCGRAWPLLAQVAGRVTDTFLTPQGCVIGSYFTMPFYGMDWVERFQVVQEALDDIRVVIVARKGPPPACAARDIAAVRDKIAAVMGQDCRVTFEYAADIRPSPSGKFLFTISKVARRDERAGG